MFRSIILLLLIIATAPAHADERTPTAPERFFVGRLESTATLKIIFRAAETVSDHGTGRIDPDGTTVLDQIVERPGEPPRRRVWHLRQTTPGKIEGTLSGAKGPVRGDFAKGVLRLFYTMSDGIRVEQRMTFAPDGRSARNHMIFRKFGIGVATLEGTVRRLELR
jgi:hypothetical protein